MGFELIIEDTVYLKNVVYGAGSFVGGVWIADPPTITYIPFEGLVDAYRKEYSSVVAPEGLSDEDARLLFTSRDLKTHQSLATESHLADIVYITNPATTEANEYTVFAKAPFDKNKGFKLIDDNCPEYLIVRSNRV